MRNTCLILLLGACLTSASAWADIVHLKDGAQLEGAVKKSENGWTVTDAQGKVTSVAADQVERLELTGSRDSGADLSQSRLLSLRRASANLTDARDVVERYRRFVEQYAGTAAADEARKDLATWQQRLDQGLVRVGDRWVTPDEMQRLREEAAQKAQEAARWIEQGRWAEAEQVLRETLVADPQNAAALYLRGLSLLQQDQLPAARKALEQSNDAHPGNAATLNNLGVILWRQNQRVGALNYYDQAMAAAPASQRVLDNVAEALNGLSEMERESQIAQRAQRRFAEQEARLAAEMSQSGKYRWGATWVTRGELDRLEQAQERARRRVASLAAEADAAQAEIRRIGRTIAENEDDIQEIERTSWYRDSDGRPHRRAYPALHRRLRDESARLEVRREQLTSRIEQLEREAQDVRRDLPVPPYTGSHQLIGVGGMPGLPGAGEATTQPEP